MKKVIVVLLIACMLFSSSGCSILNRADSFAKSAEAVFSVGNYDLQITADSNFRDKTGGNFDLQIYNGNAYVSIMAYEYIDLPRDTTPMDVYNAQNEDIFSKREAVTLIEDSESQSLPQHIVAQTLYSAEQDGFKNYYASYLVDFPESETFAWVLVTAMPSYLSNNREYLHNIVCSLTTIE